MRGGSQSVRTQVSAGHVLQNEVELEAVTKRLKRAQGQIAGIVKMIEDGRSCEEVVHQMSAVTKAVNTAAVTLIGASLEECIIEGKRNRVETMERLQKLFVSLV